jgi:putative transposase
MRRWGLLGSFGTVGDCFDNAAMESFWARLQVELFNTRKRTTTFDGRLHRQLLQLLTTVEN